MEDPFDITKSTNRFLQWGPKTEKGFQARKDIMKRYKAYRAFKPLSTIQQTWIHQYSDTAHPYHKNKRQKALAANTIKRLFKSKMRPLPLRY